MSLKFPPHGSVHENRIKPLPLSLPERAEGEWGRGGRLQFVEVGADLLENLLHGALGVELGAEGLAGEGGHLRSSSRDGFWPRVGRSWPI